MRLPHLTALSPVTPPPDAVGTYAVDITTDDVTELETFLRARLAEVFDRYRPGAPEACMAQALAEAAGSRIDELRDWLDSTIPADLERRLSAWNSLVCIVEPWRGVPGHNGERWQLLTAVDELRHRRQRAAIAAAQETRR